MTEDISNEDLELLLKIQKDTFQYFPRMSDKKTGLTRDSSRPGTPSSIAATGFSLAALAIGDKQGWLPEGYAKKRINLTLNHLINGAEHERGFFYHFLDMKTGKRVWQSEASSIDTALLVAGALLATRYFPEDIEMKLKAEQIYHRVDWKWMMNNSGLMCMGWKPESGFLPYYWDTYNEHLIIQALALGSPTHPIDADAWNEWFRYEDEYMGHTVIYAHSGSLFTYQYPQAFIDFRNLWDRDLNYFENSVNASKANHQYSWNSREQHASYRDGQWGLSASVGPGGYKAYGAKPGEGVHDGTIAPYAAISSIVFTPKESIAATKYMYEELGERLYGHFGFKGAYNLDKNWFSDEYLGIDQGVTLLMLENFLTDGEPWKKFSELEAIKKWVEKAQLQRKSPSTKTISSNQIDNFL